MSVARNVAALLTLLAFAGSGTVWAQGSLRLPPIPESTPTVPASPPAPALAPKAEPAAPPPPPPPKVRASQIQAIQLLLRDLGLYSNSTNGTLGPATRSAIREFQRSNGDPETGEPSDKLLEDLRKKKQQ